MERNMLDQTQNERKTQIIESLLQKPNKKPDFAAFKGSNVLRRVQEFMPQFIQTTDRLLSDPVLLKQSQMDIKVEDNGDESQIRKKMQKDLLNANDNLLQNGQEDSEMNEEQIRDPKTICMDIGVGVYDINNENFDERNFKPSSTKPIVQFNNLQEPDNSDDESSDGSDDSNLYYEFNSDQDSNIDSSSAATKDTNQMRIISEIAAKQGQQKRPMIIEIIQNEEEKKQTKQLLTKRKRKQRK